MSNLAAVIELLVGNFRDETHIVEHLGIDAA
jgi:hypothetical protein